MLGAHYRRECLTAGLSKALALQQIFPGLAPEIAELHLTYLHRHQILLMAGDRISLPAAEAAEAREQSPLVAAILARFERGELTPPTIQELAPELTADVEVIEAIVHYLADRGTLVRLAPGLVVHPSAVSKLRDVLVRGDVSRFSVSQFKDRFGITRKWAIPLLEHLDAIGFTQRIGNERLVVQP